MATRRVIVAIGSFLAFGFAAAPETSAGEFTISACQADRANFATVAFDTRATRGMRWKRACNPQGPGLRGLLTGNVVRGGRVVRGAHSAFVLDAPPGTAIVRYRWSGHAQRRDCRYALQIYAERPGAGAVPIKNVPANRRCPKPKRAQGAGWPRPRSYDVGGATRIVQRVVCVGAAKPRRWCSARGLNYIRTFTAQATVVDNSPPTVSIAADNPFTRGEWVRGEQIVNYHAADNVGVREARSTVGGVALDRNPRPCDYAKRTPCPNGPGAIRTGTIRAPEGTNQLSVVAEDAAGNTAAATATVRIDNTPPGAVAVSAAGGEGWRNANAFDLGWGNPPEGDRAPITTAHYRICGAGTGECRTGSRSGVGIAAVGRLAVPGPGEWDVRVWRGDAAGNSAEANASVPVRLRFDPEPPSLGGFELPPAADPTRVSVLAADRVSGVAGGSVEISRQGSASWQTLPTSLEGGRLVTRIDDSKLPPGRYLLRASARDHAGNLASTDRRTDGRPMVVDLPLRVQTRMEAGKADTKRIRRTVRRGGKRRTVSRRVQILRSKATVRFGQRVRLAGRLANSDGQPLASATVHIYSRTPLDGDAQLLATVETDPGGRFAYRTQATSTRLLQFVYGGSATILPANAAVEIRTRGRSTLRVSDRRIPNGRSVTFSGRVQGRPLPAVGKLVEMQVRLSGGWETFRTPRAGTDGRWRLRYRFARTCGVQRFRFRARLPKEAGYPYETGASPTVTVRVRGRPCS